MSDLAIVIPAFKAAYFSLALQSLASQTCSDFTVYVGDDCSPDNLEPICRRFNESLKLHYHRFETNMGSEDLVGQWERCVGLINGEKWLWLFSDDDLAEKNCVKRFYEALVETKDRYDVYRFNTEVIDADGNYVDAVAHSPLVENPMQLAYNILLWRRGNSMPDHIFRYQKYRELNGFVNFAYAQASDWATSIHFAHPKGLFTIEGPLVKWRASGSNVSSRASVTRGKMILGHLQFLEWITTRFNSEDGQKYNVSLADIREAAMINMKAVFIKHYKGIPYAHFAQVVQRVAGIFHIALAESFRICSTINLNIEKSRVRRVIKRLLFPVLT